MITDTIFDTLKNELDRQSQLLKESQENLESAPEGFLYIRETGKKQSYYHVISSSNTHIKISDSHFIRKLIEKSRHKAIARICRNNIKVLKKALKTYIPLIPQNLLSTKLHELSIELYKNNSQCTYHKAPFDPKVHKHETVSGDMVRSKSEVIISNALWHYSLPANYEELFPYPDADGNWFYPDFTIHCPDGTVIIWEHWGLLDKHSYCLHNAGKLHTYNENGFIIGKNLIITQDDNNGNCSTALIYHIIENYILPHFQ